MNEGKEDKSGVIQAEIKKEANLRRTEGKGRRVNGGLKARAAEWTRQKGIL